MIPLRVFARKKDEANPDWWIISPDNKSLIRWGGLYDLASRHDLIVIANGRADQDLIAEFAPQNLERYQPARHG